MENLRRQAIALIILEVIEGRKIEKELDPRVRQIAQEIAAELEGLSEDEKINKLFDLLLAETEGIRI
jgi:ribosome assembly protein YihI (activator of Der GTPase)